MAPNSENRQGSETLGGAINPPVSPQRRPKVAKEETKSQKFWRVVFGSTLGFVIASIIMSLLFAIFSIALVASLSPDTEPIPENSVLELTLSYPIVERAIETPFSDLGIEGLDLQSIGLDDILASINNAATDNKIKGISLDLSIVQASPASLSEIRDALTKFKKSGKFVYAYADSYSQGAYYLASVADQVFLNPQGDLDFKGLAFQLMFYKGLLDKLDVEVQVVKCGKFKSAVEPYLFDKMSEANREQMTVLGNSMWNKLLQDISASRKVSVKELNAIADSLSINTADDALAYKLVDKLVYRTNYRQILKNKIALSEDKSLNLVALNKYRKSFKVATASKNEDKIAVIYANGEIIDGQGDEQTIGSETLSKEIRRAYKDESVKAIVLRVNSPGGSALASEVIWNELENAKAAGKKIVTSMGNYAASGGYYISCNSDAIVAQANTLTGSIGVFGMIPNLQNCLKEKLGITIDVAKTNTHADAYTGFRAMDENEYLHLQKNVDVIYDTFLEHVSQGREIAKAQVDSIGQGRVWTGTDALRLGLVDKLGTLDDAIALAAQLSGMKDYKLVYYPLQRDWIDQLLNPQKEDNVTLAIKNEMGDLYYSYAAMKQLTNMQGIQARMPMELIIK